MGKMNKAKTRKTRLAPKKRPARKNKKVEGVAERQVPSPRAGSKLAAMIAMLRHGKGATIESLCEATGWRAHSVRGALSGAIKKNLGLPVTSEKSDGVRIYRISG